MKNLFYLFSIIALAMAIKGYTQQIPTEKSKANFGYWLEKMQDSSQNFYQLVDEFDDFWDGKTPAKGSGYKQFKRWQYFRESYVANDGTPLPADFSKEQLEKFREAYNGDGIYGEWECIGPFTFPVPLYDGQTPGLGRITTMGFDPVDANVFYAGTPAGGLWRTTNGGSSWKDCNTDVIPTMGVSSIVVKPDDPNVIYVGTGDKDASVSWGLGVYKSFDNGYTWEQKNSGMGERVVNKLLIDPIYHNLLLAATNTGVYKTLTHGNLWAKQAGINANVKDMVYKPGNRQIVYAVADGTFYRSEDYGSTWDDLIDVGQRAVIGVTPANPDLIYIFATLDNIFYRLYISTNGGNTWDFKTSDDLKEGQGWYNLCIAVDPNNENVIYAGMVTLYKSTNAGDSWSQVANAGEIHADQHYLGFSPLNGNLYIGNDGGVYNSADGGNSYNEISQGLAISAPYRICVWKNSADHIMNGQQDCGSYVTEGNEWFHQIGGDGFTCEIDPNDRFTMYGSSQKGNIYRSMAGGAGGYNFVRIAADGVNGVNQTGSWYSAFVLDQVNTSVMFAGFKDIWRSENVNTTNAGDIVFTNISQGKLSGEVIDFIEQSPADRNMLYFTDKNSANIYRGENVLTVNPTFIKLNNKPEAGSVKFEAHPTQKNIVYMTCGYGVYKSENYGNNWSNISGTLLPPVAKRCIVYQEGSNEGLYVGTTIGVYFKDNSMTEWIEFKTGLPPTLISDIEINYSTTPPQLFATTYGRGIWKTDCKENYKPNLTIFSGAVNASGNDLEIITGVLNDESQTIAENFKVGYYLSTNEIISRSDFLIGEELVPILYSGVYLSSSLEINMAYLPAEISKGTWYVGAIVDYSHSVAETDETDNIWHSGETVEIHVPYQPQNIQATDGDLPYVTVSWEPPPNLLGTVYYRVYRAKTTNSGYADRLGDAWQPGLIFHDFTAEGGTNYYYWVKACYNPDGIRPGAWGTKDAGWAKLSPPINVQASQGTYESRIKITWEAVPASTHFKVYRSTVDDLETAQSLTWNWSSVGYYNDYSAQPGQVYYYWVRSARSPTGYRASPGYSEIAEGFRAWADAPEVTATKGTFDSKVDVAWNAVSGASYYRVYRNDENNPTWASPVTNWQTSLSYTDFTAAQGEYYYYWVKAANNPSGTLPTGFGDGDKGWRRLSAPETVIATDGTYEDYIYLVWNTSAYADYYNVYRSEFSGYGYGEEIASGLTGWEYFDEDVLPGITYYYWVKAYKNPEDDFLSDFSPEESGWKKLQPSVVTATKGVYPWSIHIDFTPVEGAYLYQAYIAPVSNPQDIYVIMDWTSEPSFHLELGFEDQYTPYYVTVEASRDYSYENPSAGFDIGFAGQCGNLADVAANRQAEMNGTTLTINHRVVNNGAWPTTQNARIVYRIKSYSGGDDIFEVGDAWVSTLNVGQYVNISHSFNLLNCAETVPFGEYTIEYQLDEDGDVCENDESDNLIEWQDVSFNYSNAMHGIYTIGGDDPDFENFNDAVDDITLRGISDSVTFYVRPGTYSEQITISSIEGGSESNWVTFTSDPSKSDTAVLSYTNNEDNYVINLQGATYVNIQNLKLISEGYSNYESTYGHVITLSNCYNINIRNNRMIGANNPAFISIDNALIFASNGYNYNISISTNSLEKGSYGIYYYGSGSGDDMDSGIEILNNQVSGFYASGVLLQKVNKPVISGNTITSTVSPDIFIAGIDVEFTGSGFQIEKNKVNIHPSGDDTYGIKLKYCVNSEEEESVGLLANNFISVGVGNGSVNGLLMFHCIGVDVYYNSINLYGNGEGYSSCFEMDCYNSSIMFNNEILNNICSNTAGGLSMSYSNNSFNNNYVSTCNFNDYYFMGDVMARFGDDDFASLDEWQESSGFDENSITSDPDFYSETNLHLTGFGAVGKAFPLEYIVDNDIDGDLRDMVNPDIGADEFEIPAADYDLSILLWDIFIKPVDGTLVNGEQVIITLFNDGIYPMSNTEVSYQINGGDWISETVSETIEPWDFYDYWFAEMADLSIPGDYEIIAKLSNPQDQNPFNDYDTIHVTVEPEPYCEWIYWMGCDWMYNLETVELNTLSNQWSGCSDMGFGDYTYLSTDLEQGEDYQLTIQTGFDNMYVSVWIDFDDDQVFNDADEKLVSDLYCELGWMDYTATLSVPVSAYPSTHRMRVRSVYDISGFNACDEYEYGEAEDYSVNITSGGGLAVNIGSGKMPAFCQGETATLTADVSGGTDPYTYLWSTGATTSSINFTAIMSQTLWVFVSDFVGYSALDEISFSVNQSPGLMVFSNQPVCEGDFIELIADGWANSSLLNYCSSNCNMPSYCSSGGSTWGGPIVSEVMMGDISNNTWGDCQEYSDFTNMKTDLAKGEWVSLQVSLGFCDPWTKLDMGGKVYIDWNRDGDFYDAEEMVSELYITFWEETYWVDFVVPEDAVLGTTKMRIVCQQGWDIEVIHPCGNFDFGETEDYAIEVYESGENYIESYSWTGPDGYTSTEQYPFIETATVSNKGQYFCTITDGNGCTSTEHVFVFVAPSPDANAGFDQTLCEGSSAFISGTVDYASGFMWMTSGTGTFDDENSLYTYYHPDYMDAQQGTVELTLFAWPSGLCWVSDTSSLTITITPAPIGSVDPLMVCNSNASVNLDNAWAENYSSLSWESNGTGYFDDPNILNPDYFLGPDDIGQVELYLEISGLGDCNSIIETGFIDIQKQAEVFAGEDATLCEYDSLPLSAEVSEYMMLQWETDGDGFFSDESNPETSYFPGPFDILNQTVTLTLTAESNFPCTENVQDDMILTILPNQAEVNAGEDATTCGDSHQLNAAATEFAFIFWTSAGDGTFNNQEIIDPIYTPGTEDLLSGIVEISVEIQAVAPCTAFANDQLLLQIMQCHEMNLQQGWAGISSWVDPLDADIENIFAPVVENLIILQNTNGMFWPMQNINTLNNWNTNAGYVIKMSDASVINLIGESYADGQLQLFEGWNLMPVLSPCPVDVADLFLGSSLTVIKEAAGYELYWPQFGINTLGGLMPGKAYFALMETSENIVFPECSDLKSIQCVTNAASRKQFIENSPWEVSSGNVITHIVGFPTNLTDEKQISQGSFIGAFGDDGNCFGASEWNNENLVLILVGDDPLTAIKDGFVQDEQISYRLYSSLTNTESEIEIEYHRDYPDHTGKFNVNGISVARQLKLNTSAMPEGLSKSLPEIFPNPAKDKLYINCEDFQACKISIYDAKGSVLHIAVLNSPQTILNIEKFPTGILTIKITGNFGSCVKKVLKGI